MNPLRPGATAVPGLFSVSNECRYSEQYRRQFSGLPVFQPGPASWRYADSKENSDDPSQNYNQKENLDVIPLAGA
jgi:hypothetical protein